MNIRIPVLFSLAVLEAAFNAALAMAIYRPAWPYVAAVTFLIALFLLLRICRPLEVT